MGGNWASLACPRGGASGGGSDPSSLSSSSCRCRRLRLVVVVDLVVVVLVVVAVAALRTRLRPQPVAPRVVPDRDRGLPAAAPVHHGRWQGGMRGRGGGGCAGLNAAADLLSCWLSSLAICLLGARNSQFVLFTRITR
jgi:hypothetical protein